MHMPRYASRISLTVTAVRIEKLQDITEEDAKAEGLVSQEGDGGGPGSGYKWRGVGYHGSGFDRYRGMTFHTPAANYRCSCHVGGPSPAQCAYQELWDSLHGAGSWFGNPEVVVISFARRPG
jgi:hypothetical protein